MIRAVVTIVVAPEKFHEILKSTVKRPEVAFHTISKSEFGQKRIESAIESEE